MQLCLEILILIAEIEFQYLKCEINFLLIFFIMLLHVVTTIIKAIYVKHALNFKQC